MLRKFFDRLSAVVVTFAAVITIIIGIPQALEIISRLF